LKPEKSPILKSDTVQVRIPTEQKTVQARMPTYQKEAHAQMFADVFGEVANPGRDFF